MGAPYHILQEWLKLGLDDSFMASGACKGATLEVQRLFFAENGRGIKAKMAIMEAKRICTIDCEVNVECLEYALAAKIDHGVWGATLPEERVEILKRRSLSSGDPGPSIKSAPCTLLSIEPSRTSGEPLLVG